MRLADLGRRATALGTALSLASLGLTIDNVLRVRRPSRGTVAEVEPLSVLIPMRNEASTASRCLTAVLEAADRWPCLLYTSDAADE